MFKMIKFEKWVDVQLDGAVMKIPFLGLKISTRQAIYTLSIAGLGAGLMTLLDKFFQH